MEKSSKKDSAQRTDKKTEEGSGSDKTAQKCGQKNGVCCPKECHPEHPHKDDKTCSDKTCGDETCSDKSCTDKTCSNKTCTGKTCGDKRCDDKKCSDKTCTDKTCNSKTCNDKKCTDKTCSDKTCNSKTCNDSCMCHKNQKCSVPASKNGVGRFDREWNRMVAECFDTCAPGSTGITRCNEHGKPHYSLNLPHGITEKDIKISKKGNTVTVEYNKEVKTEKETSQRSGKYFFTLNSNEHIKDAAIEKSHLVLEVEKGESKEDGALEVRK